MGSMVTSDSTASSTVSRIGNIVGWLGTALVSAAVAIRFLWPDWQRYAYWGAWAGLVCVLAYVLSQWREIAQVFSRRQARIGTVTAASIVIVAGILVGINYIGSRQSKRWDLTAGGQFSLSDQTRQVLQRLDAPVKIVAFDRETQLDRFRDRLDEYQYTSKNASVEYVDPDKKPAVARQYQVQQYGTVVFEYKGRTERVTSDSEQDLTNGLIKVLTGEQKKIYFVQGHGEKDTVNSERAGYNGIVAALGRENYAVDKVVLPQQGDVPGDAAVLVVAGPRTDLFPQEIDALRRYLGKGGKILFLLDPPEATGSQMPNLRGLLKEWAIELGDNVVVDVSGMGQLIGSDASVPVAATYPSHPITERMSGYLTAFPLARAITPAAGVEGRSAQTFVETGQRSWAETDVQQLVKSGKVEFEEAKGDTRGPVSIAAAVSAPVAEPAATQASAADSKNGEPPKPETRIAVVGDSDFAANFALGIQGNADLFLNIVSWLAQQENLIAIRPKQPEERRVTLTNDQQRRIAWFGLLIIPGFVLGTGVYTWWRRR